MRGSFLGTRIRTRRRELGLKQSSLAEAAGISPSYMNLIEHNHRPVSGKALMALAKALDLELSELSEGAEAALTEELRAIIGAHPELGKAAKPVEEFVGRYPDWARVVAAQARQIRDNEAAIATFNDRQNFDPHLQNTLHEMLTTITAIRSASGILTIEDDLSADQRNQFEGVVHSESRRLSDVAQDLVSYFDHARQTTLHGASSQEAFERFVTERDYVFDELEGATDPESAVQQLISSMFADAPPDARARAKTLLTTYAADAKLLPLDAFYEAARRHSYAADALALEFDVDLHSVFRRLASLRRPGFEAPKFGLVIINAAGQPMFRRPLEEFSLPRFASICALWPVFEALSRQGQPLREIIVLPNGLDFLAQAIALPQGRAQFGQTPTYASAMLVTALNEAHSFGLLGQYRPNPRPVGTSCRLCQRTDCLSRSEPSILPPSPDTALR